MILKKLSRLNVVPSNCVKSILIIFSIILSRILTQIILSECREHSKNILRNYKFVAFVIFASFSLLILYSIKICKMLNIILLYLVKNFQVSARLDNSRPENRSNPSSNIKF